MTQTQIPRLFRSGRSWNFMPSGFNMTRTKPVMVFEVHFTIMILIFLWGESINPLTPKIRLLILLSSCNTFPCKLVPRIWCKIKMTTSPWYIWVFSLPVCWIVHGYCREKLHVNHFRKLKHLKKKKECQLTSGVRKVPSLFSSQWEVLHKQELCIAESMKLQLWFCHRHLDL